MIFHSPPAGSLWTSRLFPPSLVPPPPSSELRKDKCERAPGGVTPGENPDYYAAVARADSEVRDRSPVKDAKQQRLRPPEKVRAELVSHSRHMAGRENTSRASRKCEMCRMSPFLHSEGLCLSSPTFDCLALSPDGGACSRFL